MSLTTSAAIGAPSNAREVFEFCRGLLGTPVDVPVHEQPCLWRPNVSSLSHPEAVGLPASLWIFYSLDGPLPAFPDDPDNPSDPDGTASSDPTQTGWASIEVIFDTDGGYETDNGARAADLHAWLVSELGHWLNHKNLPWKWQDRTTGAWNDGFHGLNDYGDPTRGALPTTPRHRPK